MRWGWGSLIGWRALIMRASQQVIRAHPEYRRDLDEQLCTRLLFALLNLGEMLAWLSQPPCQLTLIPATPRARVRDPLSNELVHVHGLLLFLSAKECTDTTKACQ
jgi:hypothetical protein